jgi:hypothetical protein
MSSPAPTPWPTTFNPGDCVRLRDVPEHFGLIVRHGDQPDEWLVAFRDGERNVYLLEHLEQFAPNVAERIALGALCEPAS